MVNVIGNFDVKFMYCLFVFYNEYIKVGCEIEMVYGLKGLEVMEEVFEFVGLIVFDEVENWMYIIKVVMVVMFGD